MFGGWRDRHLRRGKAKCRFPEKGNPIGSSNVDPYSTTRSKRPESMIPPVAFYSRFLKMVPVFTECVSESRYCKRIKALLPLTLSPQGRGDKTSVFKALSKSTHFCEAHPHSRCAQGEVCFAGPE